MIIRVARLGHLPFAPVFATLATLAACAGAKPEPPPRASGANTPSEWLRVKDLKREYLEARRVLDSCDALDAHRTSAAAAKDENLWLLLGADAKIHCRKDDVSLVALPAAPAPDGGNGTMAGVVVHFALDLPARTRILWAAVFLDGRLVPGRVPVRPSAEARVVLHLLDEEDPRARLEVVDRRFAVETGGTPRVDLLVSARAPGGRGPVELAMAITGPVPSDCAQRPRATRRAFGIGVPWELASPPGLVEVPMRACLSPDGAVTTLSTASPRHPRLLGHALDGGRLDRFEMPPSRGSVCCIPVTRSFERVK